MFRLVHTRVKGTITMKFNEYLDDIQIYEAGKPIELVVREFGIESKDIVKLASNENPLGTSPAVQKTLCDYASKAHLYPDDSMHELKSELGKKYGVDDSEIIIGAGSDQILEFISRAKLKENSHVLMSQVTFAMYEIYAKQVGAKVLKTDSYEHKKDEFIDMMSKNSIDIVYICTPNNPTGDAISRDDVFEIIEAADSNTLVVIDGAYMEYASHKDKRYQIEPKDILGFENVIYLGTFSKLYGLGGMRVGYGIANSNIMNALYKMRPPFNITTLSLASAIEASKDTSYINQTLSLHQEQISRYEDFAQNNGIKYIPSYTNFVTYLLSENENSSEIAQKLLEKGMIIRDLASYGLNALRITVGTQEQNSKFFQLYKQEIL